jgi:hypothetical protein
MTDMEKATKTTGAIFILLLLFYAGCADKGRMSAPTTTVNNSLISIPTSSTQNITTSTTTPTSTTARTTTTFAPDCKDSDRRDIYSKGNVSGYGGTTSAAYNYMDECVNETAVLEYYCYSDGSDLREASEEISCPGSAKCSDGACVRGTGPAGVPPLTGGEYVMGLSDKGFLGSYGKYKFRISGFLYHQDSINGITLDVMRPDNTIVTSQASLLMSGILASESLEIFFPGDPASDSGGGKTASIYVRNAIETAPSQDARLLIGVSDKGFSSGYAGYKFKIDKFIHSKESDITGLKLFVQRPDGAVISPDVSLDSYIKLDKILVLLPSRHSIETPDEKRADLYVWPSRGGESEKVDLTGIGVAAINWSSFAPQVASVKYTETGKYESFIKNALTEDVSIESVSARDLKSGQDCELIRVNSIPVDKESALIVRSGDSFKITAQCPRKVSDERYSIQLRIDYYSFEGGVKKGSTETGEIKGTAEL